MQGKMKAQMFYAPGDVRFEETDIPQIGDDEILVKVRAALTNHYSTYTIYIWP